MKRLLARLALALLALAAELAGRSLTHRIDIGRHVGRLSYEHAAYYPFLLAGVKIGIALMAARVAWRFVKAHRVASLLGGSPRVRVQLSWKLWLASFAVTSTLYLANTGIYTVLHSSALPVFAVLSVIVAALYRSVELWLREYEQLAARTMAFVRRLLVDATSHAHALVICTLRSLFGLAFESRPPPLLPA
jgi:hypothetical protein